MSKGSVYLDIPGIGRAIAIWEEVFFKLRVSFDGLVIRKEVFSESSHRIETHLDVVVEVIEVQSSVAFYFYLDDIAEVLRSIAVSPLSSIFMRSSYNFGELISCLRFQMPPILYNIHLTMVESSC